MKTRNAEKRRREAGTSDQVPSPNTQGTIPLSFILTNSEAKTVVLPPAPIPFTWTSDRVLILLTAMGGRKPSEIDKYVALCIQRTFNARLKMHVPFIEVWKFMYSLWDLKKSDKIENKGSSECREKKYVKLPDSEIGNELIEKIRATRRANEDQSGASTSNDVGSVSHRRPKKMRVVVERMDKMLTAEQKVKLLNYKFDSSKTTLEDTISNIRIDNEK